MFIWRPSKAFEISEDLQTWCSSARSEHACHYQIDRSVEKEARIGQITDSRGDPSALAQYTSMRVVGMPGQSSAHTSKLRVCPLEEQGRSSHATESGLFFGNEKITTSL